jgi:acylphosphatase
MEKVEVNMDAMSKARFYIKGKKVQDIGYRPFIMKEILRRKGLNGIADNYKYSVEILLEGDEDKIIEFYKWAKKEENKPEGAKVSQITELQFLDDIHIPKASEYSQALTFEQMGKGISILERMGKSIDNAREEMGGMKEETGGMKEEMHGMRQEMKEEFEKLPSKIAEALQKSK